MNRVAVNSMIVAMIGLGAALVLIAYLLAGKHSGISAAFGAVMAVLNFRLFGWIADRVVRGSVRKQTGLMLLLIFKMGALMALIYYVISRHWIEPIGFLIGFSALVLGAIVGSVHYLYRGNQSAGSET